MLTVAQRRLPIGAEVSPGGGAHFRVWAPRHRTVEVVVNGFDPIELQQEPGGYFSGFSSTAQHDDLYGFRLDKSERVLPDPASRFQPEGPQGLSALVDASAYTWLNRDWPGIRLAGQVLYELHVGTFTPEGTWNAARRVLPDLAAVGITALEVMPVADFVGEFGWGYDGVSIFAPTRLYGTPDDFRAFVDEAHGYGLGVLLDVVYNHVGPRGCCLRDYSPNYFAAKASEWGEAFNFDGPDSGAVREFILANVRYWITEFQLDGLRLDATQQIFDTTPEHILGEIARAAHLAAGIRSAIVVAENEPQDANLVRGSARGADGLDALWNDDFHHSALVATTGRAEAYYSDYLGTAQELISAAKWGFLYQGQYYSWQKKNRGTPAFDLKPSSFITYTQNHDQIANGPDGRRLHQLTSIGRYKAITAFMLLIPSTPMLFQGQEYCATTPFLYFADQQGALADEVRKGRASFMDQFPGVRYWQSSFSMGLPRDRATFERCKLDPSERSAHKAMTVFHADLLKLRREDPVFKAQRSDWLQGAVLSPEAFVVRFFGGTLGDRLLVVNLGRDLQLTHAPEPLLALDRNSWWQMIWTSENPLYGGAAAPPVEECGAWNIPGHAAAVLCSTPDNHTCEDVNVSTTAAGT